MFIIGIQVFKNNIIALIPPALLTSESIFKNQFIYTPLYDIIQLVFLLSSFIFFNKGYTSKKLLYLFLFPLFS